MSRRVAITGVGLVTPAGSTVESLWASCLEGRTGIGPIEGFDVSAFTTQIAGQVRDWHPEAYIDEKLSTRCDRFCQFGLVAAHLALADAGYGGLQRLPEDMLEETAVIVGSGIGGLTTFEYQFQVLLERGPRRVSPFFVPMLISDMCAGMIAIETGAKGPNLAIVTACATSTHNIGEAALKIRHGMCDVAIAGGAEGTINQSALSGFCAAKALSRRNDDPAHACRPFDRDRDGFVMSEGGAIMILEEMERAKSRGAKIYGELAGYGATGDAYHITAPAPDGDGAFRAMRVALRDASLEPGELGYINAHAPGTHEGDLTEAAAIERLLGDDAAKVSVSSTKPVHGHQLGATGGTELAVCLLAMRDSVVPHTVNCDNPERDYAFDLVREEPQKREIVAAMSNSFGFGGHNAVLVVKKV
jgi:3-oxoacyl-[acyl-carrier-protein] synthase II